jgi:hypothetical protein
VNLHSCSAQTGERTAGNQSWRLGYLAVGAAVAGAGDAANEPEGMAMLLHELSLSVMTCTGSIHLLHSCTSQLACVRYGFLVVETAFPSLTPAPGWTVEGGSRTRPITLL